MRRNNKVREKLPFLKTVIEYVPSGKYHTKMVTKTDGSFPKGENRKTLRKAKFAKKPNKAEQARERQSFIAKEARQKREVGKYLKGKKNWVK